jgi:membrane-bound ClpP family serine protease
MSMKNDSVDLKLHMTVKTLAILQGKIICILNELVKKASLLREKEEAGEEADHLLEMISDNLNELLELFEQRKELRNRIENLKQVEKDQIKR